MKLPILYKKSNLQDKINQWEVIIENDSFYTISGYYEMKQFQGDKTICLSKNVGKSNSTSPQEQATFEAKSLWQKKFDSGYWENIKDTNKSKIFEPMLAQDFTKLKDKVKYPLASSPKLDGIRCIAKSDGLWTRNGKQILSAPHILKALQPLFDKDDTLIFDGELYADKEVCDFNTIVSCVRKTKPTQDNLNVSEKFIEYWIYDFPSFKYSYNERVNELEIYVDNLNHPKIKSLGFEWCYSESKVIDLMNQYLQEGYEGQMIRVIESVYEYKRSKYLMKHKVFHTEEFIIVGVKEGIGKLSNKIGALLLEYNSKSFECAVNGTHDYLEELYSNYQKLIGKQCTVRFFEITKDGVPRFPKCIEIDRWDL